MATAYYEGRTESEWLIRLNEFKAMDDALAKNQQYVSLSAGGKAFTRITLSPEQIRAEISYCFRALQILNSATYGMPGSKTFMYWGTWQPT
jgi:hypothetical protein